MPYTDDPENRPADQVRFLLGDTNNAALDLTDNEIAYLLSENDDNTLLAAARGADSLVAKYTRTAEEKRVGPLAIRESTSSGKSKAERYKMLAQLLWAKIGPGTPYAGGISRSDKATRRANGDRVRPSFSRGMFEYNRGYSGSREERLG